MIWPVFGTREKLPVRLALTPAQTLETLRVPAHLATLLGQRGALSGELALPCDTDREDLWGFLPSRRPAEGRQATGDASRILRLAHPMAFGHPKERCDGVGADRHSDLIEA
jgi:hypothetical protein